MEHGVRPWSIENQSIFEGTAVAHEWDVLDEAFDCSDRTFVFGYRYNSMEALHR